MSDDDQQRTVVPAYPGHVALYVSNGKLTRNAVVAWETYDSAWPITLNDGQQRCSGILFPDGHVECVLGEQWWPTLAAFCRAHKVRPPRN